MKRRDVLLATLGLLIIWQAAAMLVNRPILPTSDGGAGSLFQGTGW